MADASEGAKRPRLSHVDSGAMDGAADALTDYYGSRSTDSFFPDDANVSDVNVLDTGVLCYILEPSITAASAGLFQGALGANCCALL